MYCIVIQNYPFCNGELYEIKLRIIQNDGRVSVSVMCQTTAIGALMLFSVLGTEIKVSKTLFSVHEERKIRNCVGYFSVPGDGHLAYSMPFSVPRDGNHGLENAIFRPRRTENKELRSLFSVPGDGHLA